MCYEHVFGIDVDIMKVIVRKHSEGKGKNEGQGDLLCPILHHEHNIFTNKHI